MTVALVDGETVRIGHVGDSRAYLVRDHKLEQLTEDHSLVGELIRSGRLSPEEAEAHPHRSVITRVLGTDPEVDVDAFSIETKPGDLFMLCSDGLTSMVDDARILEVIEEHRGDVDAAGACAGRRGERERRRGQHHRRPVHDRHARRHDRAARARSSARQPATGPSTRTRSAASSPCRRSSRPPPGPPARRAAEEAAPASPGGIGLVLAVVLLAVLAGARRVRRSRGRTSSGRTRTATSRSTRACRGTCRSASTSTARCTRAACSRPSCHRPSARSCSTTRCAAATTPSS